MRVGWRIVAIAAGGVLLFAGCTGTPELDREKICTENECRAARQVVLVNQHGEPGRIPLPRAPWIVDGVLSLPAGERVALSFTRDKTRLFPVAARSLEQKPRSDARSALFWLKQTTKDAGRHQMVLAIRNPFDRALQIFANMQPAGMARLYPMPLCTIPANSTGTQNWTQPTVQVTLWHFRLTDSVTKRDTCPTNRSLFRDTTTARKTHLSMP